MFMKQTSFLDSICQAIHCDKISSLNFSSDMIIAMTMSAGVGCLIGLLCKHLARMLIIGTVLALAIISILSHLQVIHFDVSQLKTVFGAPQADSVMAVLRVWLLWVQNHVQLSVSAVIGFCIGYIFG